MLLSPLFLDASQTQLNRTLDRFARFMRSAQTLSVDIRAHIPKFPGEGRAHLTLAKPNLERFSAQWGVAKYGFAQGSTRFVEYIPNDKSYVQGPSFPSWITPPGELLRS